MRKTLLCLSLILLAASGAFTQDSYQWGYVLNDENVKSQANSIVTDSKQESYVTGTFTGVLDFGKVILDSKGSQDAFVAKLDRDGVCLWAFAIGNANLTDGGTGIALHPSENGVFVTGHFQGTVNFDPKGTLELTSFENTTDIFVAAYGATGSLLWAKKAGGDGADFPNGVCTDPSGAVYVTGFFTGSTIDLDPPNRKEFSNTNTGTRDIFIVKYDDKANYRYGGSLGAATARGHDEGKSIFVDKSGALYVGGYFSGAMGFDFINGKGSTVPAAQLDGFLARYSAAEGTLDWAGAIGGEGIDQVTGVAAMNGKEGDVVSVTGFFSPGDADFDMGTGRVNAISYGGKDIFVAQYSSAGTFAWGNTYGGSSDDEGNGITITSSENVYVTGYFNGNVDFDPDLKNTAILASYKGSVPAAFMARYNSKGEYWWAEAIAGSAPSEGLGLSADGDAGLYLAGCAGGSGDFIPGKVSFVADVPGDVLIAKYDTRRPQTISFSTLPTGKVVGDAAFTLSAFASSGLPVSFSSSNTSIAQTSGNILSFVGAGTSIIFASQGGDGNYYPAPTENQTITISKGNQTITFNAIAAKNFGDAAFAVSATASSGLAVSFVSSNPAVATVSGNTITIIGAGSTIITASQAGNVNYNAAANVTQTLTVNKANQTITFGALAAKNFGDAPFTVSATASSGLAVGFVSSNTAVATVSGNTITIVGAGSTTITASQGGNANYNAALNVTQTLTINKANQTITFAPLAAKNVGDPAYTITALASSSLPVSFTSSNPAVATISGNTITIVGMGTSVITASQAGNANYNAATTVSQTLTVNKADQTITFGALASKNFGDPAYTISASASSGLPVSFTSSNPAVATISGNTITIVGVGTSTITASQAGNANYNAAANVLQTLTVNKASQTISFAALAAKNYGAAPFSISATASSGLSVSFSSSNPSVATISGTTVTIVGVGSTIITASQSGNATYEAATPVQQTLVVNKLNQTITFAAIPSKNYGAAPFTINASASSGLPVSFTSDNPSVATISGNTVTIVGTGTAFITASQAGNANYNAAPLASQTLTVNKASQTISFSALASVKFGDPAFSISATSSSGLPVTFNSSDPSVASISGNTITILAPGTTIITASQGGNVNYSAATSVSHTLVVNKADQTISFSSIPPKNFDDAPFTISATASSGLAVSFSSDNPSVATVSGNTITIVSAGTATITATQSGNTNYNAAPAVMQVLSVNNSNQSISFAPLPSKNFGDPAFVISATASSGLPVSFSSNNPAVATISGNTVTLIGAGTAVITASQSGDANFGPATPVSQNLTVAKIDQTISFASIPSKTFGDASFTITATASSNLPVSFSSDNLSVATVSGNTITIVGAGSVTITAFQSGNSNYNAATPVDQIFTINKANQTLTFPALPAKVYTGEPPFSNAATATSGLPVVFTSSDESVLSVSGNTFTILAKGTVTITASQPGDANYNPATSQSQTLLIELPTMDIIGRSTVAENTTQYYSVLPVLEGYKYYWYYSDASIDLHDSSGVKTAITFKPASTDGSVYCDVYTPSGVFFYTLSIPVNVNHRLNFTVPSPNCLELDSINPCSGVYIDYVKIGNLENVNTGCSSGGYADYTQSEFTTKLSLSDVYTPEIRLGYNGTGTPTFFVGFWIDFNNNGSFEDAGEFLSSFYGSDLSFPLHSIRVSNNSDYEGPRRMRVRVRTSGSFTSADGCIQQGDKGETEDYLVILTANTKLAASSVLTPNNDNKNDLFFIKGVEQGAANKLVIFDRTGKVWFSQENYDNTWGGHSDNGSLLQAGTYYYVFTYGDVQVKGFFELLY